MATILMGDIYSGGHTVTFAAPKGIVAMGVTVNKKVKPTVPDATTENIQQLIIQAQDVASHEMAKAGARRMRSFFNPKNRKFYVGIGSEKTPRGITVPNTPQGTPGAVVYMINEKRRSLRLIRQGLRKGAKGPHSARFIEWLGEKQIDDLSERKDEAKTKKSTVMRLANYVYRHGMSTYWAREIDAAQGNMNFNYPQYYNENYASPDAESIMKQMEKGTHKSGLTVQLTHLGLGVLSAASFQVSGNQRVNIRTYEKGSVGKSRATKAKVEKITVAEVREEEGISSMGGSTAIESGTWTYEERMRRARELAAKYNKRK